MAAQGDQKPPSGQWWLLPLPVLGGVLGGVAGYFGGDGLDVDAWKAGLAGPAGVILGFVTGLGLIAFGRLAPRPTPGTPPPDGHTPGQPQGESATGIQTVPGIRSAISSGWAQGESVTGLLPVQGIGPAFSFGQRVFALVLWALVGIGLISSSYVGGLLGAMVAGVILLAGYSSLRVKLFVGLEGAGPGREPVPPHELCLWGTISLGAGCAGLLCGLGLVLASSNPLRGTPYLFTLTWSLVWCVIHAFGVVAAFLANKRNERWWGLTIAGLVLNAVLLAPVAYGLWMAD